ncbi:MAG TPA: hypothetical protein VK592_01380 [Candidatus Dormibacteraeota bacterium]|nr:hypothetical protein [Candidatus Dormibacteraeota bacterium]
MGRRDWNGHCRGRPIAIALLATTLVVVALAVAAAPAVGWPDYVHGTSPNTATCSGTTGNCHPNGTGAPGTNEACQSCHAGFALHPGDNCWTCHKPGLAPGATAAACTGTCHTWSAADTYVATAAHSATIHLGSNLEPCTTCHAMSVSWNTPGKSPHHNGEAAPEAPTCTTCHTATPVDKAPAPHPPLVASVTSCTTCHVGMSPHPAASSIVKPMLTIKAVAGATAGDVVVSGTLKSGATALAGVTVYLQVKTPGSAAYSDLSVSPVTTGSDGSFSATVSGALAGSFYRAVSQGIAGPPVVSPAEASTEPVKATLTLKLSSTSIMLHKSITARGVLGPASLRGLSVKLTAQRKVGAKWKPAATKTKASSATTGAFTWKYTPTKRGSYRVFATIAKTAQHTAAKSPVRLFKVK